MKQVLGSYINGNYEVTIYNDGTKIRRCEFEELKPDFAENCDVKITDYCDGHCPYCYEGCSENGKHANLLDAKWVDTLHPYTELALNGNDLSHPDLIEFLKILKDKKIITNITVNQKHFIKFKDKLHWLIDNNYIYGLGVSLVNVDDFFINSVLEFDNIVIHTIAGILSARDILNLLNKGIKLLILGYKTSGRGMEYKKESNGNVEFKIEALKRMLPSMSKQFKLISFDNLALEQLDVKNTLQISDDNWKKIYMGNDGDFTFYIDMVENKYAKNSVSYDRFDVLDSIDQMFNVIKSQEKVNNIS